jgi:hypothetical protein
MYLIIPAALARGYYSVPNRNEYQKQKDFGRTVSSGMLRRVALVRTDVLEELSVSFIRVTRIGELRTAHAAKKYCVEECCLLGCYAVWLL